jgi:NAD(P)-dependent dehydrogenase (short-subunit alcohol dehydrogenase family)
LAAEEFVTPAGPKRAELSKKMSAVPDKEGKLNGKVAIVTGASRGIGAAIAERLAAEGATIAVNYAKSAKQAESVVETIISRGGKAKTFQADLGDPAQARSLVNAVFEALGRIDILVNNAGSFASAPLGQSMKRRSTRRLASILSVRLSRPRKR